MVETIEKEASRYIYAYKKRIIKEKIIQGLKDMNRPIDLENIDRFIDFQECLGKIELLYRKAINDQEYLMDITNYNGGNRSPYKTLIANLLKAVPFFFRR